MPVSPEAHGSMVTLAQARVCVLLLVVLRRVWWHTGLGVERARGDAVGPRLHARGGWDWGLGEGAIACEHHTSPISAVVGDHCLWYTRGGGGGHCSTATMASDRAVHTERLPHVCTAWVLLQRGVVAVAGVAA